MALTVVSLRPTGAVSCGISRASFRSGGRSVALASMAPLHGGALTLQTGAIRLTCKVMAASRRMVVVACANAAGPEGDAPLDPKATLPEQLKNVAERTLSMLRQLPTPKKGTCTERVRSSVELELGMLLAECEDLVEELAAGRNVSYRAASIALLGFHARVDVLLELLYGSHATLELEESTMKRLQTSMAETKVCLEKQGVRAPAAAEEVAETELPKLVRTLAEKTITLLGGVSLEYYISKDLTLAERTSVYEELKELRDRCLQLIEEETAGGIPVADHAAAGVLLGLHARFRVFLRDRPDSLDARTSAGLATSLTETEQRVKHYVQSVQKKTSSGDAVEEVV